MKRQFDPSEIVKDSWLGIVAERAHLYIGYVDRDHRHRYVNSKYSAWFKLKKEDILGKTLEEIAVSQEVYEIVRPYEYQAMSGQHVSFEIKLPEPQAGIVSFVCEFIPHFDTKTGEVLGIICVSHDVTEKERFATAAQTTEQRFRSLTNTISQLMWTTTGDGQIDFVNNRFLNYLGVSEIKSNEEWIKQVHPEDRAALMSGWKASLQTGETFKLEYRLLKHSGTYRWFLGHIVPIQNMAGAIDYWIGTATDIEDERCRELELTQAKLLAESANKAKSAFLANMSHEIRTPLGAILGFTQLLEDELSPTDRAYYFEVIKRNGVLLTRIIDDLLDLARIEAGRFVLEKTKFNVRDLVADVLTLFNDQALKKKIQLTVNFDAAPTQEIESDPVRLRQILINLIGNAVKFTDQGQISVHVEETLEPSTGNLLISFIVQDTGCGLTEAQASQLFKPFTQADPSLTRRYGGTGLGLALSRRLAEALGGDVQLRQSQPNMGSTFVAWILIEKKSSN